MGAFVFGCLRLRLETVGRALEMPQCLGALEEGAVFSKASF